jgi:uncharacterized protein YkwD
VVLVVAAVGGTASAARVPQRSGRQLRTLNHQIAVAINNYRSGLGLSTLTVSSDLYASARQHSLEMGEDGYFDHSSADGTSYWKRIQHYYTSDGYSFWTVGENLLWTTGRISAANALKMWIASAPHRRNLRDKNWTDLGVSAVHVRDAPGVYNGATVTIITTDFGARH